MIQKIRLKYGFDSEGLNFKDGVQDGSQLGSKDLSEQLGIKHFNFDFL